MKRKKRIILPIVMALVLTIITCIPIFAYTSTSVEDYLSIVPSDLGQIYSYSMYAGEGAGKFYLKLTPNNITSNIILTRYKYNDSNYNYGTLTITKTNDRLVFNYDTTSSFEYRYIIYPKDMILSDKEIYIPIYTYNMYFNMSDASNFNGIEIYFSGTISTDELLRIAYNDGQNYGYNLGFNEGLYEGQNIQQYTNLTGYVTQLLTQFVGADTAQYITPISIVLVILFVYFLFIRFILSMIKAKGVIKTCDIIMIVASIILLVIMYAPMLDLTIKNETIKTETTIETTATRTTNTEIWTEHTETGDIMHGPMGTVIIEPIETVETTDIEQKQTISDSLVTTDIQEIRQ